MPKRCDLIQHRCPKGRISGLAADVKRQTMRLQAQIVAAVQQRNGFSRTKSNETVEALLEVIKESLASGGNVLISGFGKLSVKEKRGRKGRNPATGDAMMLAPRKVITFNCSGKLRKRMNGQSK